MFTIYLEQNVGERWAIQCSFSTILCILYFPELKLNTRTIRISVLEWTLK